MWFKRQRCLPVLRRVEPITWGPNDGIYMREFWKTNTGKCLRLLMDDAVYEKASNANRAGFIQGMVAMRNYILTLQAEEPEQVKGDESPKMTTIQE